MRRAHLTIFGACALQANNVVVLLEVTQLAVSAQGVTTLHLRQRAGSATVSSVEVRSAAQVRTSSHAAA